jgi:hypothetical protein
MASFIDTSIIFLFIFHSITNCFSRLLKTDSIPIYSNGYKPKSLKFRLRANVETSHSVRYDIVVVVASIVGGGERFLHGMVRSRKPSPLVPLTIATTTLSSY